MTEDFEFTCWLRVFDPEALYAAALVRAEADGIGKHDAMAQLRSGGGVDVSACLIMLLDPGTPPAGCEIMDSRTEWMSTVGAKP